MNLLPRFPAVVPFRAILGSAILVLVAGPALAQHSRPAHSGLVGSANSPVSAAQNPAALARLEGRQIVGQAVAFFSSDTFESTADSYPGVETSTSSDGTVVIPALYYSHRVNERWGWGLSLLAPGGVGDSFDSDSPQRYLVEDWNLFYLSLAPAVGYRATDELSVGAALNVNYVSLNYESAVYNGPGESDGSLELNAGDIGFGFQLGLLYEFSPQTRVGLAYRSETSAEPSDDAEFSGLTPAREAMLDAAGVLGEEIEFDTTFPQLLGAGLYHEFGEGWSTTADVAWMDFSEFGLSEIAVGDSSIETREQEYDDIWFFALSLAKRLNEKWTAMVGGMHLTSGVDDENRTFTFRMDEVWGVGVGAEYNWNEKVTLGLNLNYFILGDAPVESDIPQLGTLRGEFTDRDSIGLDFTISWAL